MINKYSKDELMLAVREELIAANIECGISDRFTDEDYKYLGVLAAAIERLDSKVDLLLNTEKEKQQ